jgi:hypothetical protein
MKFEQFVPGHEPIIRLGGFTPIALWAVSSPRRLRTLPLKPTAMFNQGNMRLPAALERMLLIAFRGQVGGDVINRRQWSDKTSAS